jgi:hypothetical protein
MATRILVARIKDHELNQEAAGFTNHQAISLAISNHIQASQYNNRVQWGALVRYLHGPSQVGGIRGRRHTNQEIATFLVGVNTVILTQIQSGAFN